MERVVGVISRGLRAPIIKKVTISEILLPKQYSKLQSLKALQFRTGILSV